MKKIFFVGIIGSVTITLCTVLLKKIINVIIKKYENKIERAEKYYALTKLLIEKKRNTDNISKYFIENNYKNIAIYGMGSICELFFYEIESPDINIVCFIDKNYENIVFPIDDIKVISVDELSDFTQDIDVIVVTPIHEYDNISNILSKKTNADIISLEDVIYMC